MGVYAWAIEDDVALDLGEAGLVVRPHGALLLVVRELVHVVPQHVGVPRLLPVHPIVLVRVALRQSGNAWCSQPLGATIHVAAEAKARLSELTQLAIGLHPIQENSESVMLTLRVYPASQRRH